MGQIKMRTVICRGCGKEIGMIDTQAGKTHPVDPESVFFVPCKGPNTYISFPAGAVYRGRDPDEDDRAENCYLGYKSHFDTCEAADSFHKKQKSERVKGG